MNENPLPDNPMEIVEFYDLWSECKNDWDLAYRAGMEKGYKIAYEIIQKKIYEKNDL